MAYLRLPGLIDPHVHLRDPGQTEKEDFATGTKAALAGGFTTVLDMPNNTEPITTEKRLLEKREIAKDNVYCDVGFYFGTLGDNLEEFPKVQQFVKGLKIYLNHTTGNFILDKSKLKKIVSSWPEDLPILFHAEEETFDGVLELLKESPRPIHLCHMSTSYELKKIIEAKHDRLPVTCGVTPHHLFLTDKDAQTLGPYGMMKPKLKPKKDVDFLWENLSYIDMIESDHAPHTIMEKQSSPTPYGVPGLETTLPLLLTAVSEKRLSIQDIVRLCHHGPSTTFGIVPDSTTYIEIDPDKNHVVTPERLQTKAGWTPFNGWKVTGSIEKVTIRGTTVYEHGEFLTHPGSGSLL
jgi:carbamoyl-phosphate synthase/aspartate carbamoyltransferase/dihydroorotase